MNERILRKGYAIKDNKAACLAIYPDGSTKNPGWYVFKIEGEDYKPCPEEYLNADVDCNGNNLIRSFVLHWQLFGNTIASGESDTYTKEYKKELSQLRDDVYDGKISLSEAREKLAASR